MEGKVTWVKNPKTQPPDPSKPYVCFAGPDGKEEWVLMETDAGDGLTDADFDFDKAKQKYAAEYAALKQQQQQ
jgi:hypothetical protein